MNLCDNGKKCISQVVLFLLGVWLMVILRRPEVILAATFTDAIGWEECFHMSYVNPLYADVMTEADLKDECDFNTENAPDAKQDKDAEGSYDIGISSGDKSLQAFASGYRLNTTTFSSIEDAAAYLRNEMVAREGTIVIPVLDQGTDYGTLVRGIANEAMEHTGVSREGDYLKFQYGGWKCSVRKGKSEDVNSYVITYTMTYYTTLEQEKELDLAIAELMDELSLEGKNDYEKICGIYDYVGRNVTYDYENLRDADYKLKFTAYAALLHERAVCQGYANLLYRLFLECGIDNRIVCGTGRGGAHAWNIVRVLDRYYDVDATWDASFLRKGSDRHWFLLCEEDFKEHSRKDEFLTEEFQKAYPMGETSYVYSETDFGEAKPGLTVLRGDCNSDGLVNRADRIYLSRYLAGWEGYFIRDEKAMDINEDGEINRLDRVCLKKMLAEGKAYSL